MSTPMLANPSGQAVLTQKKRAGEKNADKVNQRQKKRRVEAFQAAIKNA